MARWQTRNYTSQVSKIDTKQLKTLINNQVQYEITSGTKKITAQFKNDTIAVMLPNGKAVKSIITKTALSYGWRYWFTCPHCHTRRATLYFTDNQLACRKCFHLHYASQSENQMDRLRRKIVKYRIMLYKGYNREYSNLFNHAYYFPKPKGMSRKRFDREQIKLVNIEGVYWNHARAYVDKIGCKVTI